MSDLSPDDSTQRVQAADGAIAGEVYTLLAGIIGGAEVLRAKLGSDANVEQINRAARRLLVLAEPIIRGASGRRRESKPQPGSYPAAATHGKRRAVLHIEDHEQVARTVERLLEKRPAIKVLHAANGETGLQMARVYRPEAILLDLDLPDLHGSAVMQRLAENPNTSAIPVIVVSGDHNSMLIEQLLSAGARDYLTKPIDSKRLLLALDTLFGEGDHSGAAGAGDNS